MPLSVRSVLESASIVLNDNEPGREFTRWKAEELIQWVNEGAGEIVIYRPPAGSVTAIVPLVPGTKQEIPEDGITLLDVIRVMFDSEFSAGKPIRRVDRRMLDDLDETWHYASVGTVRHYTFDERQPKLFYCYPLATGGELVEIVYSRPPALVDDIDDDLDLDRIYIGPLVSYVLYRALSKDSEYADGALARVHQQAFMSAIGAQNESALAASPRGPISEAT